MSFPLLDVINKHVRHGSEKKNAYVEALEQKLEEKSFFLESRHGDAFEGNMYYLAYELLSNPNYKDCKVYVPYTKNRQAFVKSQVDTLPGKVTLIEYDSPKYYEKLARSKYLANDTSFLHAFFKRPDQVYLNTWHGTPLKYLGRYVEDEAVKLGNVQRNFLCADYLLFPNKHTATAVLKSYMLEGLVKSDCLLGGYPRNIPFFDKQKQEDIKSKFNLLGKKVYAFMPTYRGLNKALDSSHFDILRNHLKQLDALLEENEVIYLNLHPFMEGEVSTEGLSKIYSFPKEIPSYDFLAACDALITDYSSVFFDFACTEKPIVLFTHDLEEYQATRGMYFDVSEMPFPCVRTAKEVIETLRHYVCDGYESFREEFCAYDSKKAASNILDLMTGANDGFTRFLASNEKQNVLLSVRGIKVQALSTIINELINDLENINLYLTFKRNDDNAEELMSYIQKDKSIRYFAVGGDRVFSYKEEKVLYKSLKGKIKVSEIKRGLNKAFEREWQRRYGNVSFDECYQLGVYNHLDSMLFSSMCSCAHILVPKYYCDGVPAAQPTEVISDFIHKQNATMTSSFKMIEDNLAVPRGKEIGAFSLLHPRFTRSKKGVVVSAILLADLHYPQYINDFVMQIGDVYPETTLTPIFNKSKLAFGRGLYKLKTTITSDELESFSIQNRIVATFERGESHFGFKAIKYHPLKRKYKALHSKLFFNAADKTVAFFRQTRKGNIALTVRNENKTDHLANRFKLNLAYYCSKLLPFKSAEVLIFEKNSSKYEEGGKVVFEYLINHDYKNVRFLLDKDSLNTLDIPIRYKKNIICTHTFKHYFSYFQAKVFIGTETMAHALELRCLNRHAQDKARGKGSTYIFLQHGPTYMVSLDSPQRTFFSRSENQGTMYIAVNSEAEKSHFLDLGGFNQEDLLLCGMPKFDKSYTYDGADKIVIMPTWRPWEFNEVRHDPKNTNYWKMIERIKSAIPKDYSDKVVIQAHPLFNQTKDGNIKQERNIDELLRETRLLITDYSSVAYDAFYRGANVIFYWEEMLECMEKYGAPTHLMINEETAPGFVCWNQDDLKNVFNKAYTEPQPIRLIQNYRKIVSFHDGKNTERLISFLKKKKVL